MEWQEWKFYIFFDSPLLADYENDLNSIPRSFLGQYIKQAMRWSQNKIYHFYRGFKVDDNPLWTVNVLCGWWSSILVDEFSCVVLSLLGQKLVYPKRLVTTQKRQCLSIDGSHQLQKPLWKRLILFWLHLIVC